MHYALFLIGLEFQASGILSSKKKIVKTKKKSPLGWFGAFTTTGIQSNAYLCSIPVSLVSIQGLDLQALLCLAFSNLRMLLFSSLLLLFSFHVFLALLITSGACIFSHLHIHKLTLFLFPYCVDCMYVCVCIK